MALHTKKLYYQRGGTTYSIDLYTTTAEVGTDYISLRDGTTTVYAAIGDVVDAAASHLRIQKSDVTKAILKNFIQSNWEALGSGLGNSVYSMVVFGDNLYAAGYFGSAGGTPANYVAKWDGSAWSAMGTGVTNLAVSLAVYNNELYIGWMGGISSWNGTSWVNVGTGVNGAVRALAVFNGELYAGGQFTTAGGVSASRIAKWNGTAWSALGSGVDNTVYGLAVAHSSLYVGGLFTVVNLAFNGNRIAKWSGSAWSALGTGFPSDSVINTLGTFNGNLIVGGSFSAVNSVPVTNVAQWNGSAWSALGDGLNNNALSFVESGGILYAGGYFSASGALSLSPYIAQWNGSTWSGVDTGMDYFVHSLCFYNSRLHAGGAFNTADGMPAAKIARRKL